MLDSAEIRAAAVVDAEGRRYYTATQAADLLGKTRTTVSTGRTRITASEVLASVPVRRGARPKYLFDADRVDAERAALLNRLGAVEPVLPSSEGASGERRTRRLAELEPAYIAALRFQELAREAKALEERRLELEQKRLRIEREQQECLAQQLLQFYAPTDIPD